MQFEVRTEQTLISLSGLGLHCLFSPNPVGIWCQNDVVSTLLRRHFYVMCPLGICPNTWNYTGYSIYSLKIEKM